ncbi:unnamed protein product [Linum tenue]|uniref:Uncharacterized protein n=1 Tax=Linum tenue TaxID=586396 RepID=A0AAV0N1M5_9ROSI|nr:unnamed protein product [Linum tenue]
MVFNCCGHDRGKKETAEPRENETRVVASSEWITNQLQLEEWTATASDRSSSFKDKPLTTLETNGELFPFRFRSLAPSRNRLWVCQLSTKRQLLALHHYPSAKFTCCCSSSSGNHGVGSRSGESPRLFGLKEANGVACGILAALAVTAAVASPVIAATQLLLLIYGLCFDKKRVGE